MNKFWIIKYDGCWKFSESSREHITTYRINIIVMLQTVSCTCGHSGCIVEWHQFVALNWGIQLQTACYPISSTLQQKTIDAQWKQETEISGDVGRRIDQWSRVKFVEHLVRYDMSLFHLGNVWTEKGSWHQLGRRDSRKQFQRNSNCSKFVETEVSELDWIRMTREANDVRLEWMTLACIIRNMPIGMNNFPNII